MRIISCSKTGWIFKNIEQETNNQNKCDDLAGQRAKIRNKCIIFGNGKKTKQAQIYASADS
ncbi:MULTISPECIES: hypothetical protein, partial [unclassified Proteiniphilum]|uniref:hypothetical protein n=1 Tax=unclassified Proteiniphilum TaxID=2622718 RepID=UPI00257978B5